MYHDYCIINCWYDKPIFYHAKYNIQFNKKYIKNSFEILSNIF